MLSLAVQVSALTHFATPLERTVASLREFG